MFWCPSGDGLWPHLTVEGHLESVSANKGGAEKFLAAFRLKSVQIVQPDGLSAGERSRLNAARALASDAAVLVMDEPLAHVDPAHVNQYWDVIREHCRARSVSLVFATHAPEDALRQQAHLICLEDGRAVWQGPALDLYENPPNRDLATYLGPVNWFEPDEAHRWLGVTCDRPIALRPERLRITESGPLVLEESCFGGGIAETRIRDEETRQSRRFYHRPERGGWERGMKVALAAVLSLAVAILPGCGGDAESTMEVSSVRSWSLPAEGIMLPAPRAMTYDPDDRLLVMDDAGRMIVYGADGELERRWWMPEYDVGKPEGVCVLDDGRIAVADTHYHRVVFFDNEGNVVGMFGEEGEGPGQFIYTSDVAQDAEGNLFVAEYGGNTRVQKFTPDGEFLLQFGKFGTEVGEFQRAGGLAIVGETVFVADAINNRLQAFGIDGAFEGVVTDAVASGLDYPYDVTEGPDGTLYAVEYRGGRVTHLTTDGKVLGRYGEEGRGEGQFYTPWGIAVASDGRVAVADTGNRRVVELIP